MKTKKISRILGVGVTLSLLASLLVVALPVSAVTIPQLTIPTAGDNVINTVNADYNVYFNLNQELAVGDTITITFPAGYGIAAAPTVAVAASDGWIGGLWLPAQVANMTWAGAGQAITGTLVAGAPNDAIGELASVRVAITVGITNPSATGDFAVAVKTSQETTAVSSNTVTLVTPTIPPLPGTVTGYNSADQILYQNVGGGTIVPALALPGVVRVTLGAGTYTESPTIGAGQTLTSVGGATTAILTGVVTVNAATAVLEGITVTGGVTGAVVGGAVRNCVLSNAAGAALTTNVGVTSTGNTITAAATFIGLNVTGGTVTSTGDTFSTASTGTAISNAGTLTLSGATVTGASGTGLANTGGTATVTGSSFSTLDTAVNATGGTVGLSTSTLNACGKASATAPMGAVHINGGTVNVIANTITNGPAAIGYVAAGQSGNGSSFKFNTLTGNVGAFIANATATGVLDATNNWWGSDAGPTVTSTAVKTITSPWLIASVSNPAVAIGANTLTGQATAGVNVTVTPGAAITVISAANYDGNPVTVAPPADTVKSFDVYIAGGNAAADTATITFFGITNAGAQIWAYSQNQDTYVLCSNQRVDMFNGSVIVTIQGTGVALTVPNLGNMTGLEFVLTEPAVAPIGAPTQGSLIPTVATEDVDVALAAFTWGAVAGATGYEFEMAEYLAGGENPFIPAFLLLEETPDTNGVVLLADLDYLTVYSWRVRAIRGTEEGAWVTSFFTTAAEPEEDLPDTWIIEQEATQIEWPDDITIVVPPIEQPEIPEYILWVVVSVGAILIIAVVVLIVRTRRVA